MDMVRSSVESQMSAPDREEPQNTGDASDDGSNGNAVTTIAALK